MAFSAKDVFEKLRLDAIAKGEISNDYLVTKLTTPAQYTGLQAPEPITIKKLNSSTTLEQFIESDIPFPEDYLPDLFQHLGYISKNPKAKDDFLDTKLKDEPAVTLRPLSDDAICRMGRYIYSELTTTTSRSLTAGILVLAFQLKKQGNTDIGRVYADGLPPIFNTSRDVDYDQLDDTKIVNVGTALPITQSGDQTTLAQAYAFLSASMLKMFTKSPENFMRSWGHVCKGFRTFYNKNLPISNFTPNVEVMKAIHRQFSQDDVLKSTLFRILYMSNENDQSESLKRFLYEIHLCHTGMRILPITIELCEALNCQFTTLLAYLREGEYDRQIECLSKLLGWVVSTPPGKERGMWRYGRIFSQHFMPALQTKSCPKLVYIFASALKQERPEEHSGILEIAQLQEISASDKRKCEAAGKLLIKLVRKYVNSVS